MRQLVWIMMTVVLAGCTTTPTQSSATMGRTMIERITDVGIENQIVRNLVSVEGLGSSDYRIGVNAFSGDVLLTGEVPNETAKRSVEIMARSIKEVGEVYNYLSVSKAKSHSHTVHESYLKAKMVARLLPQLHPFQYSVIVRDDIAYMMGALTYDQLAMAQQAAQDTDGVLGFTSLGFTSLAQVFMTQAEVDKVHKVVPPSSGHVATPSVAPVQPLVVPIQTPVRTLPVQVTPAQQAPFIYTPQSGQFITNPQSDYVRLYQGKNKP